MTTSDADNPFAPSSDAAFAPPRRLASAFDCWHESLHSARNDAVVALGPAGAFIATDRPVPAGTEIFLEFDLDGQRNAEIDAVVVWSEVEGLEDQSGFGVKFVDVDQSVRDWINAREYKRHLPGDEQGDDERTNEQERPTAGEEDPLAALDAPDEPEDTDEQGDGPIAAAMAASHAPRLPSGTPRLMANIDALTGGEKDAGRERSEFESVANAPGPIASDEEAADEPPSPAFDFAATDDSPAPTRDQLLHASSSEPSDEAPSALKTPSPFSALPPEALEGIEEEDLLSPEASEALDHSSASFGEDVPAPDDLEAAPKSDAQKSETVEEFLGASFGEDVPAPSALDDVAPANEAADESLSASFGEDVPASSALDDVAPASEAADDFLSASFGEDVPAPSALDDVAPENEAADDFLSASFGEDVPAPSALDDVAPENEAADDSLSASFGEDVPASSPLDDVAPASEAADDSLSASFGEDVPASSPLDDVAPASEAADDSLSASFGEDVPASSPLDDVAPASEARKSEAPKGDASAAFSFGSSFGTDIPVPGLEAPDTASTPSALDATAKSSVLGGAAEPADIPSSFELPKTGEFGEGAPSEAAASLETSPPETFPHVQEEPVDLASFEDGFGDDIDEHTADGGPSDTLAAIANSQLPHAARPLSSPLVSAEGNVDVHDEITDPQKDASVPEGFDTQSSPRSVDVTADDLQVVTLPPGPEQHALVEDEKAIARDEPQTLGALFAEETDGDSTDAGPPVAGTALAVEDPSAGLSLDLSAPAAPTASAPAPLDAADGPMGAFEGAPDDPLAALDHAFATPASSDPPAPASGDPLAPASGDPLAPVGQNPFGSVPDPQTGPELTPATPTQNPFSQAGVPGAALDALQDAFSSPSEPHPSHDTLDASEASERATSGAATFGAPATDDDAPKAPPAGRVVTLDALESEQGHQIDLGSMEGGPISLEGDPFDATGDAAVDGAADADGFSGEMELTFFDEESGPPQPVPMTNEGPAAASQEALTPLPSFSDEPHEEPDISAEVDLDAAFEMPTLSANAPSDVSESSFASDAHEAHTAEHFSEFSTSDSTALDESQSGLVSQPPATASDERSGEGAPSPVALHSNDPLSALPDISFSAETSASAPAQTPASPQPLSESPGAPQATAASDLARPSSKTTGPRSTLQQFGAYQDPQVAPDDRTPTPGPVATTPAPTASPTSPGATSTLQFGAYQDPPASPAPTDADTNPVPLPDATPADARASAPPASATPTLQFGAYQDPPAPPPPTNLEITVPGATGGPASPVLVDTSLFEAPSGQDLDPFGESLSNPRAQGPSLPPASSAPPLADVPVVQGSVIEGTPIDDDDGSDVDVPSKETWTVQESGGRPTDGGLDIDIDLEEDDELPVVTGSTLLLEDDQADASKAPNALDEAWVVAANHSPKSDDES